MAYLNNTYEEIANSFKEFLVHSNVGNDVTDYALSYINRAQEDLNVYRDWADLVTRSQLTLTNKQATLPRDCAKILSVFDDGDGDGLPNNFYFLRTTRTNNGYYIISTFAKATGRSRAIKFYYSVQSATYVRYLKRLENFTGTGTEYSFFPLDLILSKAQMMYLKDNGRLSGTDYQMAASAFATALIDFQNAMQNENADMRMESKDDHGKRVGVESYSLSNGTDENVNSGYDNDVDMR